MRFDDKPIERRMREHMSRQMTYVIHGTPDPTPPHWKSGRGVMEKVHEGRNIHPDAFHAGTPAAVREIVGNYGYSHIYRINRSAMDPIVWGDESIDSGALTHGTHGLQQQLFESVPLLNKEIHRNIHSRNPKVQVYRNASEDTGSLSFIIPKRLVDEEEGVTYLGAVKRR